MPVINMNPMSSKLIGKNVYLWTKGPHGPSLDFRPKKAPKHFKEGRIKGNKGLYIEG